MFFLFVKSDLPDGIVRLLGENSPKPPKGRANGAPFSRAERILRFGVILMYSVYGTPDSVLC